MQTEGLTEFRVCSPQFYTQSTTAFQTVNNNTYMRNGPLRLLGTDSIGEIVQATDLEVTQHMLLHL